MSRESNIRSPARRTVIKGLAAATAATTMWPQELLGSAERQRAPTALVIGAGISGLSAAYDLRKAGFNVTIFEKEKFTGGRMAELHMGPLYQSPHAVGVLMANVEMFALARELGIEGLLHGDDLLYPDTDNGHGIYATAHRFHIDEIARIPGLSDETRMRLPVLQGDLDEIRQVVDPCLLYTGTEYDDETLEEYYTRRLGKVGAGEVIRYWIEPAISAWGWMANETSRIALLSWFAQQQARFVVPKGGIGVLTRRLNEVLDVQNNTVVRYITPPGPDGRHTVHYLTPDLQQRSLTPDIVLVAVEGKYIDKMVQQLSPKQEELAKSVFCTKGVIVCYVLDEQHSPRAYAGGTYIPDHPDPIKAKTNYWWATPGGTEYLNPPHLLYALSRHETPNWQVSNKSAHEYCLPMMQYCYTALDPKHITDVVDYSCDDLFYMPVGYVRKMAAFLREQSAGRRGLYFAGDYLGAASTGGACASGRTTARTIARHWA